MKEPDKINFIAKSIWGDKEDYCLMKKRYVHQESFYIPDNIALREIRALERERDRESKIWFN